MKVVRRAPAHAYANLQGRTNGSRPLLLPGPFAAGYCASLGAGRMRTVRVEVAADNMPRGVAAKDHVFQARSRRTHRQNGRMFWTAQSCIRSDRWATLIRTSTGRLI